MPAQRKKGVFPLPFSLSKKQHFNSCALCGSTHKIEFAEQIHKFRGRVPRNLYKGRKNVPARRGFSSEFDRKRGFDREAARKTLVFRQPQRERFHSLSVRLRQPEQSRLAQTVEQLVEPCNDVVRTGCVCDRCRRFRTCTRGAGRAGRANCACFSCGAGRAGGTNCACFTCGTGRAGRTNCACFTCGAGRAGGAGRTSRSREARRSRRTRNASRPHWPHRSPFSSRSARTRRSGRSGRSHRARSVVAHHRIAHALLPAFARTFPVAAAVLSIVHVVLPFLPICRKTPAVQSMPKAALR